VPEFNDSVWKTRINMLIWEMGPPDMTLAQAEELACKMFEAVEEACEHPRPAT
jgi:hypothetical protein